jgi:hypothetical protein
MSDRSYFLHGYLSVRLYGLNAPYRNYFDNEYRRISTASAVCAQELSVRLVKTLPPEADIRTRHKKIRFKNLFLFEYAVEGLETSNPTIYFKRHWIDRVYINAVAVFLQAQLMEPVMYLMLLRADVLFLHAAGVSRNQEGFVFPAHGGTGKTTLSISLMRKGFRFLGDDLLFVDVPQKKVFPYLRPLHLFTYNIRTLSGSQLPFRYKVKVITKDGIRWILERVCRTEFLISTRVHIEKVYPDVVVSEPVYLSKMVFLVKQGSGARVSITPDNLKDLAEDVSKSFDLNQSLIHNVLEGSGDLDRFTSLESRVICRLLEQLSHLYYFNTRSMDAEDPRKLIRILDEK